jgi:DDHD domain
LYIYIPYNPKIWDSNDASIDAAQSAVDHWENLYLALRSLFVGSVQSASTLYGAAKTGVIGLEHGLLVPIRDWLLLPAIQGIEQTIVDTMRFLQSPQAIEVAQQGLYIIKQTPVVGEPVLGPVVVQSYFMIIRAWEIAQYPIPSRTAVRETVDRALTVTKWALATVSSEVMFYIKRLDANLTRTLLHTQWKVLGTGPYSTLDKLNKSEVLDHLCERYLSLEDSIARYELAAHIRAHNPFLYKDLVVSGLLRTRGGESTIGDEWLAPCPSYRSERIDGPFLLPHDRYNWPTANTTTPAVHAVALYFRLPYINGKRPGKDVPWKRFSEPERRILEEQYVQVYQEQMYQLQQDSYLDEYRQNESSSLPLYKNGHSSSHKSYPTVAQWYEPNRKDDVLVDQNRHAVSFHRCCPKCRQLPSQSLETLSSVFCPKCAIHMTTEEAAMFPPAIAMTMRPTLWRFHGPGDEVRRAVWFLDTKRHGLQPYSEESAAVLEDAFWFLRWRSNHDNALLTVQVTSPDGSEQQLVQFSSLYQVTAIQKTMGSAIFLFKRRVYRGVSVQQIKALSEDKTAQTMGTSDAFHTESFPPANENEESWVDCANEPPAILESTSQDVFDIEDLYFDNREALTMTHSKFQGLHAEAESLLSLPITDLNLEDEMRRANTDEDIDHLVLIVHGIGEMLRSADLFGLQLPNLSSIVECCGYLRNNHSAVGKIQSSLASVNGRVEYLPVEWHEAFALQSQRNPTGAEEGNRLPTVSSSSSSHTTNMNDISLRTIPNLRAFANDTLMDVLYFMSPQHHDLIIDIVTNEMNIVVDKFRTLTGFQGNISLIGHSLGSIITWDILDHQRVPSQQNSLEVISTCQASRQSSFSNTDARHDQVFPQLSFRVQNVFFLGSPIAVFLMIRNSHEPLRSDFVLAGCQNVFNLFHPYDPVAYRIEPLIDRRNADVEPRIVTHWNGGFRVQYQTKRIWKKFLDETIRTQQHVMEVVEAQMTAVGLLDSSLDYLGEDEYSDGASVSSSSSSSSTRNYNDTTNKTNRRTTPNCGHLNHGRRIDYMLQEREIETANEYVAALNAHSAYWNEKDLSLFIARQIVRGGLEAAIQDSQDGYVSPSISVDT